MSDNSFSNLPPSSVSPRNYPSGPQESNARIERAPEQLQNVKRPTRIEGEVVRRDDRTNTVRVRTARGDVDVRIQDSRRTAPAPQEGDIVELDIPAGKPPRQIYIRETQERSVPPTQTEANAALDTRPQSYVSSAQRDAQISSSQTKDIDAEALLRAATLEEGSLVRLTPLTEQDIKTLISQPVKDATSTDNIVRATLSATATQTSNISIPADIATTSTSSPTLLSATPSTLAPSPSLIQGGIITQSSFSPTAPAVSNPIIITTQSIAENASTQLQTPPSIDPLATRTTLLQSAKNGHNHPLYIQNAQLQTSTSPYNLVDARVQTIQPNSIQLYTQTPTSTDTPPSPSQTPELQNTAFQVRQIHPPALLQGNLHQATFHHPSSPQNAATTTANTAHAKVIGHITTATKTQLPVVSFFGPQGELSSPFTLQFFASNLPAGTIIELVPQHQSQTTATMQGTGQAVNAAQQGAQITSSAASASVNIQALAQQLSGFSWPTVDELNSSLQTAAMQAVSAQVSTTLPNAASPARLPAAALFFMAALRAGDPGTFLNDRSADILKRIGKADLLSRLTRDGTSINRMTNEPLSATHQDWRGMPLPMMWNGELHHIMMYYKDDNQGGDEDGATSKKGTRFIFDLDLSNMGPVQLDGFLRENRMDLILRTTAPLSQTMHSALRNAYINAIEPIGIAGELSFQGKSDQFFKV